MDNCVFDNGDACSALVSKKCEKCTFRKTRQELIAGRRKARRLLEKLPTQELDNIREKYYNGKESIMW